MQFLIVRIFNLKLIPLFLNIIRGPQYNIMSSGKEERVKDFIIDCLMGGTVGSISKTVAAPLERVRLLLQTQDANVALRGAKYKGYGLHCESL